MGREGGQRNTAATNVLYALQPCSFCLRSELDHTMEKDFAVVVEILGDLLHERIQKLANNSYIVARGGGELTRKLQACLAISFPNLLKVEICIFHSHGRVPDGGWSALPGRRLLFHSLLGRLVRHGAEELRNAAL